jgi:hypothetical protein
MNEGEIGGDGEDAGDIGLVSTGQDWTCNRTVSTPEIRVRCPLPFSWQYYLILNWTVKS